VGILEAEARIVEVDAGIVGIEVAIIKVKVETEAVSVDVLWEGVLRGVGDSETGREPFAEKGCGIASIFRGSGGQRCYDNQTCESSRPGPRLPKKDVS
jgi:hypothetical protein